MEFVVHLLLIGSEEMIWIVSFGYKSYLFLLILVLRSLKSLAAFVNSSAAFNK